MNKHNVQVYQDDLIGWTKITTGHYLTRDGKMIHGIGLTPDFIVEDYELIEGLDINAIKPLNSSTIIDLDGVSNDVYSAERILKVKGYSIDVLDNVLDANTCDELKKYQQERGIPITGVLDEASREHLNIDLKELQMELDRPYVKAVELLNLIYK